MLSLSHTLISLPFAFYLQNPFLIFAAAFVFHLFADTLLHWNIYPDNFKKYPFLLVTLDIITGLVITYLLLPQAFFTLPIWAAIAGGNAPDVLHGLWEFLPNTLKEKHFSWAKAFFAWHNKLQLETNNMFLGLISQIILVAISMFLIFRSI